MYKTGGWGEQAKARYKKLVESGYYKERERKRKESGYYKLHPHKFTYESHGSSLGYRGEELALKVLVGSKRIFRPSDLEWEGKKVEVKSAIKRLGDYTQWTSKEQKKATTYRWKFLLTKQKGKVDLFFLICNDKEERVEHILMIPDKDLSCKHLSISESSIVTKYSKYRLTLF